MLLSNFSWVSNINCFISFGDKRLNFSILTLCLWKNDMGLNLFWFAYPEDPFYEISSTSSLHNADNSTLIPILSEKQMLTGLFKNSYVPASKTYITSYSSYYSRVTKTVITVTFWLLHTVDWTKIAISNGKAISSLYYNRTRTILYIYLQAEFISIRTFSNNEITPDFQNISTDAWIIYKLVLATAYTTASTRCWYAKEEQGHLPTRYQNCWHQRSKAIGD